MSEDNKTISLETILTVEEAQVLADKIQDKIEELKQQELVKPNRRVKVGDWLVYNPSSCDNLRFVVLIGDTIYLVSEHGYQCNPTRSISEIQSMIDSGSYSFKDELDALNTVEVGDIICWPKALVGRAGKEYRVLGGGAIQEINTSINYYYTLFNLQDYLDNGIIKIVRKGK